MRKNTQQTFRLLPVAAAILLAYQPAFAEDSADVRALLTPDSYMSLGAGSVNSPSDAKRFSEYTGMNQRALPLLEFQIIKRDDATGTWANVSGRNLGLETGEFNWWVQKQGSWRLAVDYNEIVRLDPYVIHTGMSGVGTNSPTINLIALPAMPTTWATANGLSGSTLQGNDIELKLKRTAIGFSGDKWFSPDLQWEVDLRNEVKKGARMFGRAALTSTDMGVSPVRGTGSANGGWAILLTPEPIDSSIRTIESRLNFNRNQLAVSAGYYGSFYVNNFGSMTPIVPGTLNRGVLWNGTTGAATGASTIQQIASSATSLPADNQAHQLYVSGNYAFSDTTRSNFKLSYTHATQDEGFAKTGYIAAAGAPTSLGGVVDTTLMQLGLTMRPLKDLSVNASLRYEDRNDKTPVYVYNTNGVAPTTTAGVTTYNALNGTTNWPSGSNNRVTAKLDGIYRLPAGYSAMFGVDWERKKSPLPPSNTALFSAQVLFRPVLDETGVHAEIRKALSDTVNGAFGLEFKQRRGNDGDWVTTNPNVPGNPLMAFNPGATATGNRVLPDMYMDRNRTKARANIDWDITERISLQAVAEHAQDDYMRISPAIVQDIPTIAGARTIVTDSISLDSTYQISEDWRLNGYWTRSINRWNVNKANLGDDTRTGDDTFGMSFGGKLSANFNIGMDLISTRETTTFNNVVVNSANTATMGAGNITGFGATPGNYLPNIDYRTDKLNLRARYSLDKVSDVNFIASYQRFETNDWQWGYNGVPFLYSDNTTVSQPMAQTLRFIGVSYQIKI